MPIGVSAALGAAAVGGAGLQGLWSYNRENYFFDMPMRQSREFQLQNIAMARYALFREDLRDLTALTTDKVANYFVVNTLKLGFIVTIFFNFDRTDEEVDTRNFTESQISLLFSMSLCTSFFFLLISIWFSMHAVFLAESITTKLLVQTARIPWPTMSDCSSAAGDAKRYESSFSEAFRIPFLHKLTSPSGGHQGGHQPPLEESPAAASPPGVAADADGDAAMMTGMAPMNSGASQAAGGGFKSLTDLGIKDILDGTIATEALAGLESNLEPHIKLWNLLKTAWAGYDLYGRIAMVIGTSNLLTGLAFYGLYYLRHNGGTFAVTPSGWISFSFMLALAWYTVVLDLQIEIWQHACIVFCMVISYSCVGLYLGVGIHKTYYHWHHWLLTVVIILQAIWVLAVSWSGVTWGRAWPQLWRASRYLNVLYKEKGPRQLQKDVLVVEENFPSSLSLKKGGAKCSARCRFSASDSPKRDSSQSSFLNTSCVEEASDESECETDSIIDHAMPTNVLQAFAAAAPLLHLLGLLQTGVLQTSSKKAVHEARDMLYEAGRATGALPVGATATSAPCVIQPFWLALPSDTGDKCDLWISMNGEVPDARAPRVTLSRLLETVRSTSHVLFKDAVTWTVRDMERLAAYGGEPIPGIVSFLAQFHKRGSGIERYPGMMATWLYRTGVIVTSVLWVVAVCWSASCTHHAFPLPVAPVLAAEAHGSRLDLALPRPWLAPDSLGCDAGGRILLASSDNIFVNDSSHGWLGPLHSCRDTSILAADFGPSNKLWVATSGGMEEVPLQATGGESCGEPAANAPPVGMLALDTAPPPGGLLPGLAVLHNQLHALEPDAGRGWRLAGTLGSPIEETLRVRAIALHAGRALVLDSSGAVFQLDAASGKWADPVILLKGFHWYGLCALADGRDWLAMGSPAGRFDAPQLWRFTPPPGPLEQLGVQP